MNSRRLMGDPPRLFRVSLSLFRLRGNRLIAGVRCAAGVRTWPEAGVAVLIRAHPELG